MRRILGVSLELKDAELQWREFLDGFVHHEISGVEYIFPDHHPGLKAARLEVLSGSKWQRSITALYAEYGRLFASENGSRT